MASKHDQLLEHEYDGIKEYDNDLPRWWIWLFYVTIIFSAAYVVYFHGGFTDRAQDLADKQIQELEAQKAAALAVGPSVTEGELLALVKDADVVAKGKEEFLGKCAPCHMADGGGLIGPNLTDKFWLHGGRITDIHKTIVSGIPDKGMVAWKGVLTDDEIKAAAAFVWTLYGTTPAAPKEPQGEPFERP